MKIEFSYHARQRMKKRLITEGEILCTLLYGEQFEGKTRFTKEYRYKDFIIVVSERNSKTIIVTCKYTIQFTNRVRYYVKHNDVGFYEALAILRRSGLQVAS